MIVGAAAAAAAVLGSLGIPGRSPGTWVRAVVATTKAAGTARVVVTFRSTGVQHRVRLTGVVDFPADAYRLTATSSGPPVNRVVQIRIGDRSYLSASAAGVQTVWEEPVDPALQRALDVSGQVFGVLAGSSAIWQVHDLGGSPVRGGTTRYRVTVRAPAPICAPVTVLAPTLQVWVDGHSRLVRSQLTTRFRLPTAAGGWSAWQSNVQTVDLSRFGAPVTITAPPASRVQRLPPSASHSTLPAPGGCR